MRVTVIVIVLMIVVVAAELLVGTPLDQLAPSHNPPAVLVQDEELEAVIGYPPIHAWLISHEEVTFVMLIQPRGQGSFWRN